MRLPFAAKPKRTFRSTFDFTEVTEDMALPLGVLRQIVDETGEFSDEAMARFNTRGGYNAFGGSPEHLSSLLVEENREVDK